MKMRSHLTAPRMYWPVLLGFLILQSIVLSVVLRSAGITFPLLYGADKLGLYFALLIGAALLLRIVPARFRKASTGEAIREVLETWWEFPLILVAYVLLAQSYMWGKVFIPIINPRLWDPQLARLDRWIFFGVNPNVALITIFEDSARLFSQSLDLFYGVFVPMMLGVTAYLVTDRPELRKGFLAAMAVLWTLGLWLYIAVPALGPAFVDPSFAREVASNFPIASEIQRLLIRQYTNVPLLLQGSGVQLSPTLGVAAMPSLHVGAQFLFFLWLYRRKSAWRSVFLMISLLTWMTSIATGWHWAIDGIIGALLAIPAASVGWRLVPAMEGPKDQMDMDAEGAPSFPTPAESGFFGDGDEAEPGPGPEPVDASKDRAEKVEELELSP